MQVKKLSNFSFGGETQFSFEDSISKIQEALKEQGFGILTEIDAKKVLKEKLDLDRRPYTILGACNPNFAHRALDLMPEIGVLLPCNVLVYEKDNGEVIVSAMDPEAALGLVGDPDIQEIAKEVRNKIEEALEKL